ncbi:MAG: MarR family transcriptional regulator [Gemmatimonadota bacterium]|nr:MarR family transcriptional regulator [Gemmatimonadota bacterium]
MTLSDDIKQDRLPDPHTEAFLNVHFTSHWMYRLVEERLDEFGISEAQYNVLRILRGNRGPAYGVREIRERMLNRTDNATRLVEKLRKRGLVSRQPNEMDRRCVDITITEEGMSLLEALDGPMKELRDQLALGITEDEAQTVSRLLERLRDQVDSSASD